MLKTATEEGYGKNFVDTLDLTIQDWSVTYRDLDPFYDESGLAGVARTAQAPFAIGRTFPA